MPGKSLTPNTQITQENVEALEVALSQAKRGADKAGCDGWRAQEMCRQIVQLLEPVVNRPALSPPAEVPFSAEDACLACNPPTPAPGDHIGDATEKVDWARCQRCGGEIQGWICQQCHQEFEENDAGELVFCPSEGVDWERVGPKLVEALDAVLAWDRERGYRMPYRVRDPLYSVLNEATVAANCFPAPTQPQSNGE